MQSYFSLKRLVESVFDSAGYSQISEELTPDVFGSAVSVFGSDLPRFRVVWDGKDDWGFLQTRSADGKWDDLPVYLTAEDLDERAPNGETIDALLAALRQALDEGSD